jgi:hypothetical protein
VTSVLHRVGIIAGLAALSLGLAAAPGQADPPGEPPPQPTTDLQALIDFYDCEAHAHGNNVRGWIAQLTFVPPDTEETYEHVEAVGERQWYHIYECKRGT